MKNIFLTVFFLATLNSIAQVKITAVSQLGPIDTTPRIVFTYDASGNQILRKFLGTIIVQTVRLKDSTEPKKEELKKFSPQYNLSYYPNPVNQELYLKWEPTNKDILTQIDLISSNGVLLKSFENLNDLNTQTILFQDYPTGLYLLDLIYESGEAKTVKIIKQ